MSQEAIYLILKELGGKATTKQISEKAKEKYPNFALWSYVGNRLKKLEKNGYVKRDVAGKEIVWSITTTYPISTN
jgi:Fe2+ or Zn2+ uptake regulation protein